ncbi:MFS transporter [Alcaligenes parafaecalis]|uniref:MFS transporter n=1 Tax=Alcaligenes parafaecalis TaxID=171260 RepID=A0ABT3VNW7_9BURK|nr:MFS transporter [Alcaligenes parafaecalis]MCX5464968.1 MFS transporter [Alcaligenes parafaecalis]
MSSKPYSPNTHPATQNTPPWLGLSVLLLAGFVTIFDLFVVNVAIPNIQSQLGASFSQIGFIVAGYELAFGVLLITGGRLGDLFGRRKLFIIGMAGFTLASALCGLAPNAFLLIIARVLQGLAAALLFPQVYASIRVNFDGDDSRRAFGLLGMTLGLAAIAGQILGGWLIHADLFELGWRNIFLINIPIGLLAIAEARYIPETRGPQNQGLDGTGVMLISLSLSLLLIPIIQSSEHGWPLSSLTSLVASIALLFVFYRHQERRRRTGHLPLVDMQLLTQPRFALGALLVLLVYSTASSFFLCFALLLQSGFGLSPFHAGSIFAPASVGFIAASLYAPRLVTRYGTQAITAGAIGYALSFAWLISQVAWAGAQLEPAHLIPALIFLGASQGLIMTPLLNLILGFIDETQAGMASGVISSIQQIGAALGVAVVGFLFNAGRNTGSAALSQAEHYVSAFGMGLTYNLVASLLVSLLLIALSRINRH